MLRSTGIQGRGVAMRVPITTVLVILLSKLDIDLSYLCSVHMCTAYTGQGQGSWYARTCAGLSKITHLCYTELVLVP